MNRQITKNLICLLLLIPLTLSGQRTISGQIIDAEDKEPIAGASVFISNTTEGIATDKDGYYRLRIPGEGAYQLTISHVGYQSVFHDIEPGRTSVRFDAALKTIELDELTVATRVRFRQGDINLFWNIILGKTPSRRTIQATNPEVVYYYYNPETRILKVTCREPLHIINYELGYVIQYVLNYFTHDYHTDITDWSYHCNFTELKPENLMQQNTWEIKRQEVYRVSLTKFVKSLYNNTLYDDGFLLATYNPNPDKDSPYPLSFSTNRILIPNIADNSKTLTFLNEQVMLICFGRPVTEADISTITSIQSKELQRSNNYLMHTVSGNIRIYPDGTYANKLQVAPVNTPVSITGLCMKLPLEYATEVSTTLAREVVSDKNKNVIDDITQHFNNQLSIFPHEKIHLHTDRDVYVSGEKIWFKAYVTDALTHQSPTYSRYVYVELISPVDTLMHRVMVRPTDGMFYGNLPLTEYIPTGDYTLRAYTRYMENLGDDYFFKKNIRIENLATPVNKQRPTAHRGVLKDDFSVSFFPEGGNLPEGVLCKVAFKALNINGYPDMISGKLIDEDGKEISSVETIHAGMGVFEYIPEKGKQFFLKCKNTNGLEKQFALPQPDAKTYTLSVFASDNDLLIEVFRSIHAPDIPCYLLAHCRGTVLYFSEWNTENENILFDKAEFPAGIIHFLLLDKEMNPISERLVFSKNYTNDVTNFEFQTDKTSYGKRDKVVTTLSLPPSPSGRAGEGLSHFSVAITDDKDITVDSSTTILSSLLLSSELRGYIENPAYYLQDHPKSANALDYLMLTHGWRRYNIPEVVKGNLKQPQIPFQLSQQVSGKVKSPTSSRIVEGSEISILTRGGDFGIGATDENGLFVFQDFEYPDSTEFFIQALNRKRNANVELVVDRESFPKLVHAIQSPHLTPALSKGEEMKNETDPNAFITKAEQRSRYDEDMWVIHLGEVEVTAPRIEKREDPRQQFWANASSDVTIRAEEFEKRSPRTVTEMLYNIAGVRVSPDGNVVIRESGNLFTDYKPIVLIDGMPMEWPEEMNSIYDSPLERVSVYDVESIDVFKGANPFGVRGAGGAISITTKRGGPNISRENPELNYIIYTPLGYQKPIEFYSPVYETLESKHLTIPDFRTTIFWKPDIVISDTGEASFDFYTSDFPTTYSIVIEGLTTDGRIVRQTEKIRIE